MAVQTIKMRIQLRRDTTANWDLYKDSVIPAPGEPCFDLDLGTLKIGNGKDTYAQLEPIGGNGQVAVSADGSSIVLEDGVFKLAGFDAAKVGAQPVKNSEGNIEWVIPTTAEDIADLKADVAALQTNVTNVENNVTNVQNSLTTIQEIINPSEEGAKPLVSRVETLEYKMDGTGEGTVDAKINAKINDFATKVSGDGIYNTFAELITYVSNHGGEVEAIVNDIVTLQDLVGSEPVHEQISAATSGKVDKVDGKGLSSNDFTDSLLSKLDAIEEKAQVNVVENISVGGSIIDIIDKTVNIPIASIDKAGVVKSSTGANKVNISNDGVMSVNKISAGSIFVPIGDELVLDGGGASKEANAYSTRIGDIGYNSVVDAVKYADNGDVITLQEDINMGTGDNDNLVINAENVTIDLGGKTLTANGSNGAIKVDGGVTTLDGTGTVSGTLGSDKYSMAVWASNGTVVINGGIYKNETDNTTRGTDLIYASGTGCIEINGGKFEAAKPEWTLNCKDVDYKAGTAKIIVKGGSFKGFDPANNNAEGVGTNFVAEGYKSVLEGEYYVVKPI